MKRLLVAIILSLMPAAGSAQSVAVDHLTPAFPTVHERHIADVVSWGTVLTAVSLDAVHMWKTDCADTWDRCEGALVKAGLRVGLTMGVAQLVKVIVHRRRPCATVGTAIDMHGYNEAEICAPDSNDSSFYSLHTALAFSTLGGSRLAFALPLSVSTGGLRIAAGKHWLTDTLVGAGAGALTSRIR